MPRSDEAVRAGAGMSGRVEAERPGVASKRNRSLLVAALGLLAVLLCAGAAGAPYLFKGATLRSEISEQLRATMGLTLTAEGPVRFSLFPQPHVEMLGLHVADQTGTLRVDAQSLRGEVRFLPLLVGRLEIASAALQRPNLRIDLDAGETPANSAIGRALRLSPAPAQGRQRLGIVTLVDGTAVPQEQSAARRYAR